MNLITRWDPVREMEQRLSTLFGRSPIQDRGNGEESLKVTEWAPLVDISEDDKEYLIKTELPEIKKENIKVAVNSWVLSITGERKFEKDEKNRKYHRVERAYGCFIRSFTLPDDANDGKISAEFKDGVLKVHLPKSGQKKPKDMEIKIGD